ncbi:unnamed protein product [Schistosoma curassoni]|uniref:Homeobox-containing protein n=1 Tax=Schistosoma curassoni TaxID=6186 RepID=A0A183JCR4_9TREM|nr:unnamed protein product [Schistosoma curassoni]
MNMVSGISEIKHNFMMNDLNINNNIDMINDNNQSTIVEHRQNDPVAIIKTNENNYNKSKKNLNFYNSAYCLSSNYLEENIFQEYELYITNHRNNSMVQ